MPYYFAFSMGIGFDVWPLSLLPLLFHVAMISAVTAFIVSAFLLGRDTNTELPCAKCWQVGIILDGGKCHECGSVRPRVPIKVRISLIAIAGLSIGIPSLYVFSSGRAMDLWRYFWFFVIAVSLAMIALTGKLGPKVSRRIFDQILKSSGLSLSFGLACTGMILIMVACSILLLIVRHF